MYLNDDCVAHPSTWSDWLAEFDGDDVIEKAKFIFPGMAPEPNLWLSPFATHKTVENPVKLCDAQSRLQRTWYVVWRIRLCILSFHGDSIIRPDPDTPPFLLGACNDVKRSRATGSSQPRHCWGTCVYLNVEGADWVDDVTLFVFSLHCRNYDQTHNCDQRGGQGVIATKPRRCPGAANRKKLELSKKTKCVNPLQYR